MELIGTFDGKYRIKTQESNFVERDYTLDELESRKIIVENKILLLTNALTKRQNELNDINNIISTING